MEKAFNVKNDEEQGDTNSVDHFNKQFCVVCEVRVTNTNMFLCACMYGSTILAKLDIHNNND